MVLFQHGLVECPIGIIANGEESLGLKLVNLGYDLWMNNTRGNRYSRMHAYKDEDGDDYWNYTWQHMAEYD